MHPYETNGQHLAGYLLDRHLNGRGQHWSGLGTALLASNRSDDWVEALQEMASLQLARRLISAGDRLIGRHGLLAAEAEIKQAIIDTMLVHYTSASDVYERLLPAIRAARGTIRDSDRQSAAAFARREMPYCYRPCTLRFMYRCNARQMQKLHIVLSCTARKRASESRHPLTPQMVDPHPLELLI